MMPATIEKNILGSAIIVYKALNLASFISKVFCIESWRAWGLLKLYSFANCTKMSKNNAKNLILVCLYGTTPGSFYVMSGYGFVFSQYAYI